MAFSSNLFKKKPPELWGTQLIYNQEQKKKTQLFQNRFSHIYIYQINLIIYQIKHNWMNFMMVKTESKNILS